MNSSKPLMDWPQRIDEMRELAKAIRILPSETTLMEFAQYAYLLGVSDQINRELEFHSRRNESKES